MSVVALKRPSESDALSQDFVAHAAGLPGAGLAWLDARRAQTLEAFAATGIPGRRDEDWKYTDLAQAFAGGFPPAPVFAGASTGPSPFASLKGAHLVFADGVLQPGASLPEDVGIVDLARLDARAPDWVREHLGRLAASADQPMGAASLALMRGGAALRIRGSLTLHLDFVHVAPATASHARVLIMVEEGASLALRETHRGAAGFANLGIELVLRANARLDHIRLQAEDPRTLHVTSLAASLARDARYRALYVAAGAALSRLDARIRLAEPGAEAELRSVAVPGRGPADITTVMDHASPHTSSRQLFKSVVREEGRAVMQGRVCVREGAVKSDSHQLFKALLLGPRAEADAKPELEIFADDVACGHGTAIGALDEDALFYLRARGIPESEARGLLIRAFLEEAMDGFADEPLRAILWRSLDAALDAALEAEAPGSLA